MILSRKEKRYIIFILFSFEAIIIGLRFLLIFFSFSIGFEVMYVNKKKLMDVY